MEPNLCWMWKKTASSCCTNSRENLKKKCLIQGWKCEVCKPPCLWEKERRRRDIKKHGVVAILLLSFSTCSLYFYGTVWLRRSAPGVWRQRGRTGGNGWRWGARFLTGPWLCRVNWRTPELLPWLDSSPKNRTPRIRACGMGLGPGLSRTRSSELDKLGRRKLRCWLCFFFCLQT